MILSLRTDSPTAYVGLHTSEGEKIAELSWLAERRLAHELLGKIETFLIENKIMWDGLSGLVVFKGPGSFTGLRIGITVANTIAYAQEFPIVGAQGEAWEKDGVSQLIEGQDDRIVLPEYGAPARITQPRK